MKQQSHMQDWLHENEELDARLVAGMSGKSVADVMNCFVDSPDLMAVLWGTEMHGPAELRQAVESLFTQCDTLQLSIDRISRTLVDGVVIAVGHCTYAMVKRGQVRTIKEVWTDVRCRVDGKWLYVLDYAEILPGT